MRERIEPALKVVCVALGAVLLFEFAGLVPRIGLLRGVKIPALPALASTPEGQSGGKGTNVSPVTTTNAAGKAAVTGERKGETNAVAAGPTNSPGKALAAKEPAEHKGGTNPAAASETATSGTNVIGSPPRVKEAATREPREGTNPISLQAGSPASAPPSTNTAAASASNASLKSVLAFGTNSPAARSNLAAAVESGGPRPGSSRSSRPTPLKLTDLPPALLARVDRVVDSELLGPVIRPMPTALLGIAGDVAFLRAANGQSSLVKTGDNVGSVKLLRIGVNRVLVEEEGQKKELMIFEGYGGESLLPK